MFASCMKHIKGMEEFFLCTFLSYYKLDIVDHEDIHRTVLVPQLGHGRRITASYGFDYFISKGFGSDIDNLHIRVLFQHEMSDGMHKVGFTQSGPTIYIEGIVCLPRDPATARQAEWANLLLLPTTKVSNLYLGFRFAFS